jgi:hypothetical protein
VDHHTAAGGRLAREVPALCLVVGEGGVEDAADRGSIEARRELTLRRWRKDPWFPSTVTLRGPVAVTARLVVVPTVAAVP